jgi:hypothetical protein
MSNDTNTYIEEKVKEAADTMDQAVQIGETAYNLADGILSNLKAFVHDEKIWADLTRFEQKIHTEFQKKIDESRIKLKDADPFFKWRDGMKYYMDLRKWKTLEIIGYWDKLSKDHKEL